MRSLFPIRIATISIVAGCVALAASPALAQNAEPLVLAQMMHGDDKGMQDKGMQDKGMQDKGMQDKEMQGHGMPKDQGMQGGQAAPAMSRQMGGMGQGMMMGSGMPGGPMMPVMMMQGRIGDMAEYVEGRIAFLQAELRVTDAQMPAWHELANVLRANGKRALETRAAQPQRTGNSFANRLDDQELWLSVRLEGIRALKPAYAKLYAVLDDRQKKVADDVMPMLVQ